MRLIVGLGNPGAKYAETRHNVGFHWLSRLADRLQVVLRPEARFHGLCASIGHGSSQLWLLEPQTFMNASGRSVAALCRFYKVLPKEILVVHDELDLPAGVAKLKWGGGVGGHNGLRDIAAHLATKDFWRLRIGIGHPGDRNAVVNYVLQPPRPEEAALIDEAIDRSLSLWPLIVEGDFQAAMLKLHTKP